MANLSPDERAVVAKYPLRNSLDHLQDSLQLLEQNNKPRALSFNNNSQGPRNAISRLLIALQGREIVLDLCSKTGTRDIASELSVLFMHIRNGDSNNEHYRALSRLVIRQAPDINNWNAGFDLIYPVSQTTPPASVPASFDATPITHSSYSQQGAE